MQQAKAKYMLYLVKKPLKKFFEYFPRPCATYLSISTDVRERTYSALQIPSKESVSQILTDYKKSTILFQESISFSYCTSVVGNEFYNPFYTGCVKVKYNQSKNFRLLIKGIEVKYNCLGLFIRSANISFQIFTFVDPQ